MEPLDYDEDDYDEKDETRKLSYIGYEDTVINHILLLRDMTTNVYTESQLENRTSPAIMNQRFFTVQCIENLESLTISFKDLEVMKKDFAACSKSFLKAQLT